MEQDFNDKWEFYKDADIKWRWRRTSPNGNIVGAASEGYVNKTDCEGNAKRNGWNGGPVQEDIDTAAQKDAKDQVQKAEVRAHDLHVAHAEREGEDLGLRIEGERRFEEKSRTSLTNQIKNILLMIAGILCIIVAILLFMLLRSQPAAALTEREVSEPKVVVLSLDPRSDEKVVVFGDTHFGYDQHTLSVEAMALLADDVQSLKDNPSLHVRLAGYTSAKGTEAVNQELSEQRANAVRDHLIREGIESERITVIGYGRTRPALYEATPGNRESREALANMRVLFEVVVK